MITRIVMAAVLGGAGPAIAQGLRYELQPGSTYRFDNIYIPLTGGFAMRSRSPGDYVISDVRLNDWTGTGGMTCNPRCYMHLTLNNGSGPYGFSIQNPPLPDVSVVIRWDRGIILGDEVYTIIARPACYANCDGSTAAPTLNVGDFVCFMTLFAAGDQLANCDRSTGTPSLNVEDFVCFQAAFAAGCP